MASGQKSNSCFDKESPSRCGRRPGDRFYSAVQWSLIGLLAALWLFRQIAPKYIDIPRPLGFRLFVAAMLSMNILWWTVADRRFARHVQSRRLSAALRLLSAVFSIAMNFPIVYLIVEAHMPRLFITSPTWYMAAVTLWNLGLLAGMPFVAGLRLLILGAAALFRRLKTPRAIAEPATVNLSRRAMLKTSFATLPMLALAGGTAFSRFQNGRFEINRRRLPAPWLPPQLKGLTITHVSDLHVGRLYRPERLPELVEAVNRLKSDLVVVTGDIVDVTNEVLPPALDAICQFQHRYGLFACLGNHDEFDNREEFIRLTQQRLPLLVNQRRVLDIDGHRLTLAGVDWPRLSAALAPRLGHEACVARTLDGYNPDLHGPVIALAHHPHTWDALAAQGVPLTLSGHTHGGQIMFTPPDLRPDIGCGQMLFRYIRGIYERPGSTLFVNRGVGNWFPLRVNSPTEIVQIQLT